MKKLLNNELKSGYNLVFYPYAFSVIFLIAVISIDQLSKIFVLITRIVPVYFNNNVAFSLPIPWFIPWLLMMGVLCYMFFDRTSYGKLASFFIAPSLSVAAVVLIAGGGLSNLFDRFIYNGRVVDFIDLKFWPIFNLADSFIVCGVLLFLYTSYIKTSIVKDK